MKTIFFILATISYSALLTAQNVGIGTETPSEKLEVIGNTKTSNLLASGYVGINTSSPAYRLHIYDGSIGLTNTTDNITWIMSYNSLSNYFYVSYNGALRMVIENGGNVGINVSNPAYRLDVGGPVHTTSSLYVDGNAYIDGNLTVQNGKGVLYNVHGNSPLKYYTRTASFSTGSLGGYALSAEGVIGFTNGIFTEPPKVFVGDIVSTGGTVGQLYRVQLIVYGVTTTSCKVRLLNTSPNPVNYSITWNIVCIGE